MKKIALVLVALAAVFGISSAASAAGTDYPVVPPKVTVDITAVTPGGTVVLNATGCEPGETVTINNGGTTTTATADSTGAVSVSTTAPTAIGPYDISVTCGGVTTTVTVNVVAVDPGTNGGTTPTGGLPSTGSDGTNTTLMLGLGALIIGGGLFGVSQLRRRQSLSA